MESNSFSTEVGPIVDGNWSLLNLGHMTEGMNRRLEAAPRSRNRPIGIAAADRGRALQRQPVAAVSPAGGRYQSPWPAMPQSFATLSELSGEYLLTKEGKLGFVILRLAQKSEDEFAPRNAKRPTPCANLMAQMNARHPETKIGLTGLPIMENDEMRSSQTSMFWASLVSMLGVGLLFVAGFGGVRHALLANLVLLLGMAWSFGYVTLVVGHLNILSVSFTVTLIGIGIDYGVYYSARYLQNCATDRRSCKRRPAGNDAGGRARRSSPAPSPRPWRFSPPASPNFTGIAELGLIAGGGILLCAVAELLVLPAVICLVDRSGYGMTNARAVAGPLAGSIR